MTITSEKEISELSRSEKAQLLQWLMKDFLQSAKMTAQELAIEIAVYLYEKKRLTLGQAKRLADLDQISFQKELVRRDVYIHLEAEDILRDIENLGIKS